MSKKLNKEDWEMDEDGDWVFKGDPFKGTIPFMSDIPEGMLCTSCEKNLATVKFAPGGVFEATHAGIRPLCEVCYADEVVDHWAPLFDNMMSWRLQLGRLLVAARAAIPVLPEGGARGRLQEAIDWAEYTDEEREDMRESFHQKLYDSPEFREAYERAFETHPDDTVLESKDDIDRFIEELKGRKMKND